MLDISDVAGAFTLVDINENCVGEFAADMPMGVGDDVRVPTAEEILTPSSVSQGLTTGFWLPGERPTQPSRPQAPPRPLGEPQMPGRGLSQNNSGNVAFL